MSLFLSLPFTFNLLKLDESLLDSKEPDSRKLPLELTSLSRLIISIAWLDTASYMALNFLFWPTS